MYPASSNISQISDPQTTDVILLKTQIPGLKPRIGSLAGVTRESAFLSKHPAQEILLFQVPAAGCGAIRSPGLQSSSALAGIWVCRQARVLLGSGRAGGEGPGGREAMQVQSRSSGILRGLLPGALFCPLFSVTLIAASVGANLASNSVTSFCLEPPLGLCLQGPLEAFEARPTISSVWGQKKQELTFPQLSVALLMLEFVCWLVLSNPPEPLRQLSTWGGEGRS